MTRRTAVAREARGVRGADHDGVPGGHAQRAGHGVRDHRVDALDTDGAEPADLEALPLGRVHVHRAAQRQLVLAAHGVGDGHRAGGHALPELIGRGRLPRRVAAEGRRVHPEYGGVLTVHLDLGRFHGLGRGDPGQPLDRAQGAGRERRRGDHDHVRLEQSVQRGDRGGAAARPRGHRQRKRGQAGGAGKRHQRTRAGGRTRGDRPLDRRMRAGGAPRGRDTQAQSRSEQAGRAGQGSQGTCLVPHRPSLSSRTPVSARRHGSLTHVASPGEPSPL